MSAWELTALAALGEKWFVVSNDEIDEWAIANRDKPVSQLAIGHGEISIGNFQYREIAQHAVNLHNWSLGFE